MRATLYRMDRLKLIDPAHTIMAVWAVTKAERCQLTHFESWIVECSQDIEQPGTDSLVVINLNDAAIREIDRFGFLWRDKLWIIEDIAIIQWLVTGYDSRLGSYWCPYVPLIGTSISVQQCRWYSSAD